MNELALGPAVELAAAVRSGAVLSRELVELYLERIEHLNGALNAVVTVEADDARRQSDERDAERDAGCIRGPLHGVPITVKDAFATAGIRTTSGSRDRAEQVPAENAVAVARLVDAGAVVLGKTNVPEGVTGHCCGIYGHVPTQGLIPLRGHLPLVPMDEVGMQVDLMGCGPLARSPADLAAALGVLAGPDTQDGRAWRVALPPGRFRQVDGARVALWADDEDFPVSGAVRQALEEVGDRLEVAGAVVDRAARPAFRLADAERVAFDLWVASTTVSTDDFPELRARAAAVAGDRDDRAARRLRAEVMSHHQWTRLDEERRRLSRAWEALLAGHDVVVCPVSPVVAIPHDPEPSLVADLDHRLRRTIDVDGTPRTYLEQMTWNIVVGMAGLPSTVAPVGGDAAVLPVGAQIVGPRFTDLTTIAFAAALGDLTGGYRPPAMAATAVGDPGTGG